MKKLALLPMLLLSFTAHADEREWVPYKKLVEETRLDRFYALPPAERDKLAVFLAVKPKNKSYKPSDVVLTVVQGGERHPLPALTPDFRLTLVPNAKWMSDDSKILTSLPKGEKSSVSLEVMAQLPDGTQWPYAQVMGSVAQMNAGIKKVAGTMSMFVPDVKSVVFKFSKPAQLKIGTTAYNTDAKNTIVLKPDAALMKENPLMVASERPLEAALNDE